MTAMERAIPILPGDDIAIAKQFHVDGLGFQVRFEATEDGKNGLLGVDRGTLSLTIDCPMSGLHREDWRAGRHHTRGRHMTHWRVSGYFIR